MNQMASEIVQSDKEKVFHGSESGIDGLSPFPTFLSTIQSQFLVIVPGRGPGGTPTTVTVRLNLGISFNYPQKPTVQILAGKSMSKPPHTGMPYIDNYGKTDRREANYKAFDSVYDAVKEYNAVRKIILTL